MRMPTKRDERVANDAMVDRALMCAADGCPNRWSVDAGNGRLCSAHAWVDRHAWPLVTQEQQDASVQRAIDAENAAPPPSARRVNPRRMRDELAKLASAERDRLAWAKRLKARDEAGERLTPAQRAMYRDALRARGLASDDEGTEP